MLKLDVLNFKIQIIVHANEIILAAIHQQNTSDKILLTDFQNFSQKISRALSNRQMINISGM